MMYPTFSLSRLLTVFAASMLLWLSPAGALAAPAAAPASPPGLVRAPAAADDAQATSPAASSSDQDATSEDEEEGEEKEAWDVNAPPLPTSSVDIDVDEGTWMSLDVSPEGDEIVFDLLGDLFTVPIGGGEAKVLTQGMAWDMQPRYSPDGRFIAFTSDRAGGDNLWLMKRDGSDPRVVTEEKFRLLNSPAWTPDGQFVAGRKHFTKTRSLGSGEIWLYHRSGGEGVQMVEKPNDQKDLGEPAFSPDGRYLYYSQDVTPGPVFEYNKDPNGEIYAIQRLDRETGKTEKLIGGPGGAVRPTPSPDGRYLAFVRRVRAHSVLELLDLESGAVRPLYGDLERDMQETWAIHGVYPVMAWTPDSQSLVFWAGGKIHRLWIADGRVEEIPFHVHTTQTVAEALRFANDPAPDTFHTKMLRWVEVAPAGDRVVFQALGHLWVRDLPNGKPRRLTRQSDHFELYPTFSRDGKWVVYTTWNDQKLGDVRVVSSAGGEGRVLTTQPGHYIEPAVSPDSKTVIYRKIQGGWLLAPRGSIDPGLYRVPFAGGASKRLASQGTDPHFGADSQRVYLHRTGEDGARSLVSVTLDGLDERTLATSEWATRFRVSPDGRWLAFTERFNAYVTPFPEVGSGRPVGPKSKALPTRQVSRDAGEYLQWSGDSAGLYWSLGPELYHRRLPELFAFMDGAPKELPEPPASGLDIGFDVPADRPEGTLALVGGRVVTMKGDEILEDATVVVEGNRIVAVGPRDEVEIPAGARMVDVSGHTILPGIVDVHWHGEQADSGIVPEQNWFDYATLTYGVTTLHDPSNDTAEIFAAAEMARAGEILAPRIFSTGTILYGATTAFTAKVDSLEDARGHLRRMKAVGAFSVKSYNQPRREQRQQILTAARELGMLVVPEGGSLFEHNMTMVVDGHTGVEHSLPVPHIYSDVDQLWSATKVGYTPTLIVGYGGIFGEDYWYQHTDVWKDERLSHFVPRRVLDARSRRRVMAPEEEYGHVFNAQVAKRLHDLGVEVHVGAHGQREGLGAHWEMWMLVQGGMTPQEALHVATIEGARYLGMDKDLGSIETGKLADLMILEQDPLADIRNSTSISHVVLDGRLYDARTLDELSPEAKPAGPFYFNDGSPCGTTPCAGPTESRCLH